MGAVKRLVARRKTGNVDSGAIMEKAKVCDAIAKELPKDIEKFSKAHFDFHIELAQQSGSAMLSLSLSRIHFKSFILRNAHRAGARGAPVNHEHLVEVILNADEKSAVKAIVQHMKLGFESELRTLQEELKKAPVA